ncbi:MAG: hypothetical protein LBE03_01090 [Candidatus Nomurabacteria bacterium]|jgi:hypothetical protein|nr:hypothetical protein [Candidatus Nomurabacteria bacterium]
MYKVNTKYLYKNLPRFAVFGLVGLIFLVVGVLQFLSMKKVIDGRSGVWIGAKAEVVTEGFTTFLLPFAILPLIFILIFVIHCINIHRKVKKIHYLERYGILVKDLPYEMQDSGMVVNDVPIKRIAIEYTLQDGTKTFLFGEKRLDNKLGDADGKVDMLIDPNDQSNYYIDFNISVAEVPKIG